uniref:(California timema) hypothetical protein n=1 Tax=Timema californicum TaxID=61474 RepID=A0A7R9PCH1_TIMCA|nr:unnamed protein product [Timema californicum]
MYGLANLQYGWPFMSPVLVHWYNENTPALYQPHNPPPSLLQHVVYPSSDPLSKVMYGELVPTSGGIILQQLGHSIDSSTHKLESKLMHTNEATILPERASNFNFRTGIASHIEGKFPFLRRFHLSLNGDVSSSGNIAMQKETSTKVPIDTNETKKNVTLLILKPYAEAVSGENGISLAVPVSHAVVGKGQSVNIQFDPSTVAIAGPGGVADAHADLLLTVVEPDEKS